MLGWVSGVGVGASTLVWWVCRVAADVAPPSGAEELDAASGADLGEALAVVVASSALVATDSAAGPPEGSSAAAVTSGFASAKRANSRAISTRRAFTQSRPQVRNLTDVRTVVCTCSGADPSGEACRGARPGLPARHRPLSPRRERPNPNLTYTALKTRESVNELDEADSRERHDAQEPFTKSLCRHQEFWARRVSGSVPSPSRG